MQFYTAYWQKNPYFRCYTSFNMYAYLEGRLSFKSPAMVYMDVNGVGYEVNISLNTYSAIQNLEKVKLYTHLQVKEDAHNIFGFFTPREKEIFVLLIGVSGVGAATARMMLSSLKAEEVSGYILTGNVKQLERVKGIGKKTAERLVLELKDKLGKQETGIAGPVGIEHNYLDYDALTALMALGISRVQAEQALIKVNKSEPNIGQLEELIKKALKAI